MPTSYSLPSYNELNQDGSLLYSMDQFPMKIGIETTFISEEILNTYWFGILYLPEYTLKTQFKFKWVDGYSSLGTTYKDIPALIVEVSLPKDIPACILEAIQDLANRDEEPGVTIDIRVKKEWLRFERAQRLIGFQGLGFALNIDILSRIPYLNLTAVENHTFKKYLISFCITKYSYNKESYFLSNLENIFLEGPWGFKAGRGKIIGETILTADRFPELKSIVEDIWRANENPCSVYLSVTDLSNGLCEEELFVSNSFPFNKASVMFLSVYNTQQNTFTKKATRYWLLPHNSNWTSRQMDLLSQDIWASPTSYYPSLNYTTTITTTGSIIKFP